MRATILGLGEWRPETARDNDAWPADFVAHARQSSRRELADVPRSDVGDACDAIVARYLASEESDAFLGSRRRRIADDSVTACQAEAHAARIALADAGVEGGAVDVVLSWAAVPDRPTPPSAPRVAYAIAAHRAAGIGIDVACASPVAQLLIAAALVESGRAATVLVTGSHLMSRVFPLSHPASPGIGDGAAAFVVGRSERAGVLSSYAVSHGEFYDAVVWRRSNGEDTPWHRPGGTMMLGSYDREGLRTLVRDTVRLGAETVAEAARRSGIAVSEIDVLASVQPRRWVPAAIAEAVGLAPETAPQTFDELAHLGGCGIVTNLIEARRRGLLASRDGGRAPVVCLYGQGAGFTRAAVIVRWPCA
jgi:3-oxoacyl-[acyl-carrier-protein] synthase III